MDYIYTKYNGFLLFNVSKHGVLTLGKATFCGLQSLADNPPSYSMFSFWCVQVLYNLITTYVSNWMWDKSEKGSNAFN